MREGERQYHDEGRIDVRWQVVMGRGTGKVVGMRKKEWKVQKKNKTAGRKG